MEVTVQLLTRGAVRQLFHMAHSEFHDLKQPPPYRLIQSLGRRLHVLG